VQRRRRRVRGSGGHRGGGVRRAGVVRRGGGRGDACASFVCFGNRSV
jgi:hypothetical protein